MVSSSAMSRPRSKESSFKENKRSKRGCGRILNELAGRDELDLQPAVFNSAAAYVLLPSLTGSARGRAAHFSHLEQQYQDVEDSSSASSRQASTLSDLMVIRALHSKLLRRHCCLGTALGFRSRSNQLTDIPAIIVFVARKLNANWLPADQLLPRQLQGPGGIWCDVDVVEFSYCGGATASPNEQLYSTLVEGVRGNESKLGSGSQVASLEAYGTLGGLVRSKIGGQQVGFITNRHVAVDLNIPSQKMYHPLPPGLGAGMYLGAVERATSFVRDDMWYGMFASNINETYVRADGAFVPFIDSFDTSRLTTSFRACIEEGSGVGGVVEVRLDAAVGSVVGKRVTKLGRSSGVTKGMIMGYGVEYVDDKGNCLYTDFLIIADSESMGRHVPFDLEGDSGSIILLAEDQEEQEEQEQEPDGVAEEQVEQEQQPDGVAEEEGEQEQQPDGPAEAQEEQKHYNILMRPVGMVWGGTANRGCLRLRSGSAPENWTSGVDLGRLLSLLHLELLLTPQALKDALKEQEQVAELAIIKGDEEDKQATASAAQQTGKSLPSSLSP